MTLPAKLLLVVLAVLCGGGVRAVAAAAAAEAATRSYTVEVVSKASPALSFGNAQGAGHSPCNFTFNPAWAGDVLLIRAAECPEAFGGRCVAGGERLFPLDCCVALPCERTLPHDTLTLSRSDDHIIALKGCDRLHGTCPDLTLAALENGQAVILDLEPHAQDPRIFFDDKDGFYYLGYFAKGEGQKTVYLRRSKTPANASSWEPVWKEPKPWHRNFCAFQDSRGERFVLFGESPPL